MAARVVITGANGAIGRVVLARALQRVALESVAVVRSERARAELPPLPPGRARSARVDYAKPDTLREACRGALALVHLPGLLIETPDSPYERANVETTRVAVESARAERVAKLVLLSACGADPRARNRFFRTKGEAEALVRESELAYTIVRCPLVLGCGSAGDRALARQARTPLVPLLGGGRALEQPVFAGDVAEGLLNAAEQPGRASGETLELVGPECVSLRALARRAARLAGRRFVPIPVPLRLARARLAPDVIEVLTGHVPVDPERAARALGIELTSLERVLRLSLGLAEAP